MDKPTAARKAAASSSELTTAERGGEWANDRIIIEVYPKKIFIKMPKNTEDVSFINSFKYARFNKTNFLWEVPNYKNHLQIIKEYFGKRIAEIKVNSQSSLVNSQKSEVGDNNTPAKQKPNTVTIEVVDNKKIILRFPFAKEHIAKIKNIPLYYWNNEGKYWSFPYTENILNEIKAYFGQFSYSIETSTISTKDKGKKEKKNYGNERKIPVEYLEKLKIIRYSENTCRVYIGAFTDFINYYATKEIKEISGEDIKDYLLYLIEKRQVSSSFQNQVINSIKFYYEKVLGGKKMPYRGVL